MLPPHHAGWLAAVLPEAVPEETVATCGDCAMKPDAADPGGLSFSPDTKCCTYLPELANFLVGRVLRDDAPAMARGRASMEARIASSDAAGPVFVAQTSEYRQRLKAAPDRFGRDVGLRCPHYLADSGGCGIWSARDAVCATWFCKHERGAVGRRLWTAVRDFLQEVESTIARWCALELGLADAALEQQRAAGLTADRPIPDLAIGSATYRRWWGRWAGRARDFYVAAAGVADGLAWPRIAELGGLDLDLRARRLAAVAGDYQRAELPSRLRPAALRVLPAADAVRLTTYSTYDPLEIPLQLFGALARFDGGPVAAARARLRDDDGLELTDGLIQRLIDFEVLEPVDD